MENHRSSNSPDRNGSRLDKCSLGEYVRLGQASAYIPADVLCKFQKAIDVLEGRLVKELNHGERKFVDMIILLGNEYLVSDILGGKYEDSLWTPELRKSVQRHKNKMVGHHFEDVRKTYRELRRKLFAQMKDLLPTFHLEPNA